MTRSSRAGTPLGGLPLKLRVAGSKLSQAGSGLPSARVALQVRLSPSGSLTLPPGTVKVHGPGPAKVWGGTGTSSTGSSLVAVMSIVSVALLESGVALASVAVRVKDSLVALRRALIAAASGT